MRLMSSPDSNCPFRYTEFGSGPLASPEGASYVGGVVGVRDGGIFVWWWLCIIIIYSLIHSLIHSLTHYYHYYYIYSPWGEHEIDYVLFAVIPNKNAITLKPHPDEVDEYKWVSPQELQTMMADSRLLFSPWFRIICQKWLTTSWWKDLDETMNTDKYCDYTTIYEFDPPPEHFGGSGNAGPLFVPQVNGNAM